MLNYVNCISVVRTSELIKLSKMEEAINVLAQQALTTGSSGFTNMADTANKSQLLFPSDPQAVECVCMCRKAIIARWLVLHDFLSFLPPPYSPVGHIFSIPLVDLRPMKEKKPNIF